VSESLATSYRTVKAARGILTAVSVSVCSESEPGCSGFAAPLPGQHLDCGLGTSESAATEGAIAMKRELGVLIVGAVAVLCQPAYAAGKPTISRSPTRGGPGTVIKVSGTGCASPDRVSVRLYAKVDSTGRPSDTSQTFQPRPDGTWSGQITVPADAPAGDYGLDATCFYQDTAFVPSASTTFTVTGAKGSSRTTTTRVVSPPCCKDLPTPSGQSSDQPSSLPPSRTAEPVTAQPNFTG
jgi:hypothetical protein